MRIEYLKRTVQIEGNTGRKNAYLCKKKNEMRN